jgi:cytochrome c biogenesis protein CcmG, thiol:disulfide interchange protein DsbE
MRKLYLLVTLLLAICAHAAQAAQSDGFEREGDGEARIRKNALEGKRALPLVMESWRNTDGKTLKLGDLKGKVVILDFWGVWCGSCKAQIPHLNDLYRKYKDQGLVIVGVHSTSRTEGMDTYLKTSGIEYPVGVDVLDMTKSNYAVDGYPDYYVIDRTGTLRVADLANAGVDDAIAKLIKERSAQ